MRSSRCVACTLPSYTWHSTSSPLPRRRVGALSFHRTASAQIRQYCEVLDMLVGVDWRTVLEEEEAAAARRQDPISEAEFITARGQGMGGRERGRKEGGGKRVQTTFRGVPGPARGNLEALFVSGGASLWRQGATAPLTFPSLPSSLLPSLPPSRRPTGEVKALVQPWEARGVPIAYTISVKGEVRVYFNEW